MGDWCGAFISDANDVDITGAMFVGNDGYDVYLCQFRQGSVLAIDTGRLMGDPFYNPFYTLTGTRRKCVYDPILLSFIHRRAHDCFPIRAHIHQTIVVLFHDPGSPER